MKTVPLRSYWLVVIVLLLWGLGGTAIFVAYFFASPEDFARAAETATNRDAYADYIENVPGWALAIGIIAAITRLLGAVSLLLRRAWALPLYVVSVAFFSMAVFRAFVLGGASNAMGGAHIAIEVVFLSLGVFAVWFAQHYKSAGILQ